jgi:hypothetical protein
LYCFAIRKSSSQVQVLWEDHRNDLLTWVARPPSLEERG